MLNLLVFLLIGLLFGSLWLLFYNNLIFDLYMLLHFIYIYVLSFLLFILLSMDVIGVLLILVYVGGLLILIVFSVYLLNFYEAKVDSSFSSFTIFGMLIIAFILFFIICELFCYFSHWANPVFLYTDYGYLGPEFGHVYSFSLFKVVGLYLYTFYFPVTVSIAIILFVALIGVVSLTEGDRSNFFGLMVFKKKLNAADVLWLVSPWELSNFSDSFVVTTDSWPSFSIFLVFVYASVLFVMPLSSLFFVRYNIIKFLLAIELMFLGLFIFLGCFSFMLDDVSGVICLVCCLGVLAAETALGLSIYVLWFSPHKHSKV